YQGLIPWAWIEASTKGAVLLFVASEAEYYARSAVLVTFVDIYGREGLREINKGVHAVAIRQMTNWGTRFGLSRLAEQGIRKVTHEEDGDGDKLSAVEKTTASALGGALSGWNLPIEVIHVEMQSKKEYPDRPRKMTVGNAFRYIYQTNGLRGLYRGVTPRIGLSMWQTVCMVAMGDM
ncbi:mitochondrial DNA replication protein YHM2, partial [Colletotrichum orchidophilum]